MRPSTLVVLAVLVLVGSGCSPGAPVTMPSADPDSITFAKSTTARMAWADEDAAAAADAISAFGADLYRSFAADGANLVFSPTSIAVALGMARVGARGRTASEMDEVLYDVASNAHANWLNSVELSLAERSGTFPDYSGKEADLKLGEANAVFAQAGFPIYDAYLDALAASFGTGLQLVDFAGDPEAARLLINDWVSGETNERVPELLPPGIPNDLTRLALVNAIYLSAPWYAQFDEHETHDGPFTTADGRTVSVPMMATLQDLPYTNGPAWQAVELPYVGRALAMTIIVPNDLEAFEADLDGSVLATITGALSERKVSLLLPRFSAGTHADLNRPLIDLGMPSAFSEGVADFSGITPQSDGFVIQAVVHAAYIDVDERGTEAAASTAVIMGFTSGVEVEVALTVDRPFIIAVRDTRTGAILFLGRIADPSVGR
ncbi:MAG: serpin family protein [Candidatus Limnocylindria bacterium]